MKVDVKNPVIKRMMAKTDAIVNGVNNNTENSIHCEVIKGNTAYAAKQNLNAFYNDMCAKYPTFKIINVVANTIYTGIMYTVTYKI